MYQGRTLIFTCDPPIYPSIYVYNIVQDNDLQRSVNYMRRVWVCKYTCGGTPFEHVN